MPRYERRAWAVASLFLLAYGIGYAVMLAKVW